MPNYCFVCKDCGHSFDVTCEVARRDDVNPCPSCGHCSAYYQFVPTAGFVIPPYMMSPGSKGSSANACDRQAAYLKSDKWYKKRQEIDAKGGTVKFGSDTSI